MISKIKRAGFCARSGSVIALCALALSARAADEIDFNRDVRPILSDNCFACHGPDKNKRKSGLRLDNQESAYATGQSGHPAFVPRSPENSEALKRIVTKDDEEVMPPPSEHKKVNAEQLAILTKWVAQGAKYDKHWAHKTIVMPAVPKVKDKKWLKNDIDAFVLAKLEALKIKPSAEEDKERLIRRVTLDLTGLPPGVSEVDAFVKDKDPKAYEKLVDRLLGSEHFGERMAVPWLDLARYADTAGYHNDSLRDMWLWGDWVVKAFNQNKPFSEFTVEQIAGDMLPNATIDQKVASGFHRNVMTSDEGGIIEDEYMMLYVVDRVNTTGITWLGMTVGCAQCHDHKYDPLTQKDYYRMFAFFHNVPEKGKDGVRDHNPKPYMLVPTPEQQARLDKLTADLAEAEKAVADLNKKFEPEFKRWQDEEPKKPLTPEPEGQIGHFSLDSVAGTGDGKPVEAKIIGEKAGFVGDGRIGGAFNFETKGYFNAGNQNFNFERDKAFSAAAWVMIKNNGTGHLFGKLEEGPRFRGWRIEMTDKRVNAQIISNWDKNVLEVRTKDQIPENKWHHMVLSYDGSSKAAGVKVFVDGKVMALDNKKETLKESILNEAPFTIGGPQNGGLHARVDDIRIYNRALSEADADTLVALGARSLLEIPADKRTAAQKEDLKTAFRNSVFAELGNAEKKAADLKKERDSHEKSIPNTMVMEEMAAPRDTFIKVRGQYDKNAEKVTAGVPEFLPAVAAPADGKRLTRLDFAKWLVTPEQPLTSRVTINRFWAMIFGTGIVKTVNDFGMQGEWPSHPELLEWLAADFMRDWDMKRAIKQMVLSATYRQSSRVMPELLSRDSENRLLAHGPRNRLDAEFVRDNALAISGLINLEMYGKGVLPAQPSGIWEINEMGGQSYKKTAGPAQYRRGIYVYWRRSTPYPSFLTFDAPQREFCAAARAKTSTPLQSLVLMNDPVYVEAARAFALRALKEGGADNKSRLAFMWRTALARQPDARELEILERTLAQQLENSTKDKKAAEAFTKIGDLENPKDMDASNLAAWTAVGSVILNLNETITK